MNADTAANQPELPRGPQDGRHDGPHTGQSGALQSTPSAAELVHTLETLRDSQLELAHALREWLFHCDFTQRSAAEAECRALMARL